MPLRAEDVAGFEHDWLGTDLDGHVALLSTAGAGYPPPGYLCAPDLHEAGIDALLAGPASTVAVTAPQVGPGCVNTWRLVAERGLYGYDSDPNGGAYRRVAVPARPLRIDDLAGPVAAAARIAPCPVRFALADEVTEAVLRAG